jgi:signal transduction histidine kinase
LLNSENNRESLTIVSARNDAKDVFVEVQDTGPGLGPETKPEGIGMGLAISRSIAEAGGFRQRRTRPTVRPFD